MFFCVCFHQHFSIMSFILSPTTHPSQSCEIAGPARGFHPHCCLVLALRGRLIVGIFSLFLSILLLSPNHIFHPQCRKSEHRSETVTQDFCCVKYTYHYSCDRHKLNFQKDSKRLYNITSIGFAAGSGISYSSRPQFFVEWPPGDTHVIKQHQISLNFLYCKSEDK